MDEFEEKEQHIIRKAKTKENPYVMLNKGFINDDRLSYKATGILTYILSKPDDWIIYQSDLINRKKDGKKSFLSGWEELKEFGYIHIKSSRDERGRIMGWETVVFESPEDNPYFIQNTQKGNCGHALSPESQKGESGERRIWKKENLEKEPLLINDLTNNDLTNISTTTTTTANERDEIETVDQVHLKVFGTFFMNGLMSNFIKELYELGCSEDMVKEIMYETGEASRQPSLNYMKKIANRWLSEGITTRGESRYVKTSNGSENRRITHSGNQEQDGSHYSRTTAIATESKSEQPKKQFRAIDIMEEYGVESSAAHEAIEWEFGERPDKPEWYKPDIL